MIPAQAGMSNQRRPGRLRCAALAGSLSQFAGVAWMPSASDPDSTANVTVAFCFCMTGPPCNTNDCVAD